MELFKLLGSIAIENSAAHKALDDTVKKAGSSSKEVESAINKIGGVAGGIAKGVGIAGAAIGGAWIAAIEGSREYRSEMGLLEGAFQASGHSSEEAKNTYSDLNAVLGDTGQAVEAAQHIAMIADNEKEMNELTTIGTGVFQRFGQSLPLEGLMEGILHSSSLGEVQGSLADALEWSGITVEDFNDRLAECSNEEERQDLIMKTLKDTYGGAAEQYQKTNKDVIEARKAQEKLTDAFAELGRVGEPILTAIKDKVAVMVAAAVPHLENFIQKVKDGASWVKNNQDTIDKWVAVIIGASAAIGTFLLILNWGNIMGTAANAVRVVRTAILGLNAAMLANPVGLVVAAIVGLVAAFIYLWNNCDSFRNFWINLWNAVKSAASAAWTAITDFFVGAWAKIKEIWATNAVIGFYRKAWSAIISVFINAPKWFANIFGQAWNFVKARWNGTRAYFFGIWNSVMGVFSNVGGWFRSKFQSAWTSVKSVFSGWGSFFGGLWETIKSKFSSIGTSLGTTMSNAVKSGLNKALATIEKGINKGIDLINSAIGFASKLGFDIGNVAKISLPRLARGGVLEQGQIGILEGSGAEAVVPLEHNRAWLSKVAADLHEMQGGMDKQPVSRPDRIEPMLSQIIYLLESLSGMKVVLESGALVGELTPAIDRTLSERWKHSLRGNAM